MPLHLLGKKSWNVYNKASIERVKKDEAAAKDREEEKERRMQEEDAQWRLAVLRGDPAPPRPGSGTPDEDVGGGARIEGARDQRGKRKRKGEDDTEHEIRVARENVERGVLLRETFSAAPAGNGTGKSKVGDEVEIVDQAGNIQLFAPPSQKLSVTEHRNAEREAEKEKRKREFEDQYTMRFSNAAGFKRDVGGRPWYASASTSGPVSATAVAGREGGVEAVGRNVWGDEDPGRKGREENRMKGSDPMAFMRRAQTQLKKAEEDRQVWKREREREVTGVEFARRRERKREGSLDSLEAFSLDAEAGDGRVKRRHEDENGHHRRHERHASKRHHDGDEKERHHDRHERKGHSSRSGSRERKRSSHRSSKSQRRRRSRSPG